MKLTSDLIYEAALDDQLFAELPTIIAKATGARSCVLHWRSESGAAQIFQHSGYFSDDQMADYATNFANHDLWTDAGMSHGRVNQAWRTTDLVSEKEYERSIFYNEWIRGMGDDTFYCCGSVLETMHGAGIIGLHRGATQEDFSLGVLHQLNGHLGPLRRMFALRGRIAKLTREQDLLSAIFNSTGGAALAVNSEARVLMANASADAFLRGGRFLKMRSGCLTPAVEEDRQTFEAALTSASNGGQGGSSDCLLRSKDGSTAVVSLTPLVNVSPVTAVLITINEPSKPLPRQLVERHLRIAYGLSAAEADIALRLADGLTLREIGEERGAATSTVRTQFKHVLMKMGFNRQTEVLGTVLAAYHRL